MNCHESQELLQRRLDGVTVLVPEELHQHLAGCTACRQNHAAASRLLEGLKTLSYAAPTQDSTEGLVAAVLHDREVRRRRVRVRFAVTLSLAAAILLMAWAGNLWLPAPKSTGKDDHKIVVEKLPEPRSAPGPAPAPLAQSAQEAQQVVASLTNRLGEKTVEHARLFWSAAVPPVDMAPMLPIEADPLEPAAEPLRAAGSGMREGLQTVTRNARHAVDYFRKELAFLETTSSN